MLEQQDVAYLIRIYILTEKSSCRLFLGIQSEKIERI